MRQSIKRTTNKASHGFTLVEVLIVVAILGILAAIVIPSYSAQVLKTRRSDAKISLMQAAQDLERCFSDTSSYAGCTDYTGGIASAEGFYTITGAQAPSTYQLTATPVGSQADDNRCATFTLNQTNTKGATNSDNVAVTDCW